LRWGVLGLKATLWLDKSVATICGASLLGRLYLEDNRRGPSSVILRLVYILKQLGDGKTLV
jgi:hypothetical protein